MSSKKPASLRSPLLVLIAPLLVFTLVGCAAQDDAPSDTPREQTSATQADPTPSETPDEQPEPPTPDEQPEPPTPDDQPEAAAQQETCDWDSPRLSVPAQAPEGQEGDLSQVLIGAWQHTHTDEGSGFEEVTNDHRYVFSSADRMLYCQHVPGATDHAENAANIVLNGTAIELPGGKYAYTVTAWNQDSIVWDNPVGGGYVYLLQRR